jgi:AraC family transcriptional regulator
MDPATRPSRAFHHGEVPASMAEELLDEIRNSLTEHPDAARSAAMRLVSLLTRAGVADLEVARGGLAPWQMRKVDRYLRAQLQNPLRLDKVADHLQLSVSHFCRAFKESFGATPHNYIIRLRLELAKSLMLTTEEPLSHIALECGLADQAHLSKLFRRVLDETPSRWRRRNLTDAQVAARTPHSGHSHYVPTASADEAAARTT